MILLKCEVINKVINNPNIVLKTLDKPIKRHLKKMSKGF